MTISRLFNHPRVLWQSANAEDGEVPEAAIALHVDMGGILVLEQEGR